jgi:hypothetical protein
MFVELLEVIDSDVEQVKYFEDRTHLHIELVQKYAKMIGEAIPELAGVIQQASHHDDSKLEEPERTPYINITWRHKKEKEVGAHNPIKGQGYQTPGMLAKEDENDAALHHITTNSHHPEAHCKGEQNTDNSRSTGKNIKCLNVEAMPDIDIAEMVADWAAMSEELKKNTVREWFDTQKDKRWHFSPHQEELIDKLLNVIEGKP